MSSTQLSQRLLELKGRANALRDSGRLSEALAPLDESIRLAPRAPELHYNRANLLIRLGRLDEAIAGYDRALALHPDFPEAHFNRANALMATRRHAEAIPALKRLLALRPNAPFVHGWLLFSLLHVCDWRGLEKTLAHLAEMISQGLQASMPFSLLSVIDDQRVLTKATRNYLEHFRSTCPTMDGPAPHKREGKIKVGYFSADFHDHATMHLMAELLETHSREDFEFIGFSFGPDRKDAWRARAVAAMDAFHDVSGKSDLAIVEMARQMNLDIAVDLKGYTTDCRPGIFLMRAAPAQVSYLGYPGTSAMASMDWLVADRRVLSDAARMHYPEKIVWMPYSYQANCRRRDVRERPSRKALGLPEEAFVFSSFNANNKITPTMFERWLRILARTPGSVLWMLVPDPVARKNLTAFGKARGIASSRIIFADKLQIEAHLARIPCADLMLDTFPCNAHTTGSDALRMGLPILTLAGETFAARVGVSLLHAVGLDELVTHDGDSYENLAVALATSPERLARLRGRLADVTNTSPLFDPVQMARALEAAYRRMVDDSPRADIDLGA